MMVPTTPEDSDPPGHDDGDDRLRSYEANLRAVVESTDDAIWSVDTEARVVTFNTACARLLQNVTGRLPEVGDPPEAVMGPEAAAWFRDCYLRALQGTRFTAVREQAVGGRTVVLEMYFNPIDPAMVEEDGPDSASPGRQASGVVVFARDVTRQRTVEAALRKAKHEAEEASRAKSQFLAQMSHELRTPLNSIIGFSRILHRQSADRLPERDLGFLARIEANGRHLLDLINEILDLSKVEAGRLELEIESVELSALVKETLAELEAEVAGRAVELRSENLEEPAVIRTDEGRLKQILINLVANALRFTESGSVTVRLKRDESSGRPKALHVEDTGIGIPEDRLEAIFEAFQQAEDGTARRYGGTGLGLTISRSLCRTLGFEMTVTSEVGEGSTFSVLLEPASGGLPGSMESLTDSPGDRWGASDPSEDGATDTMAGRTVLVIDDDPDARELIRHYLEGLGCTVIEAADGQEGLELARRAEPHLITVDVVMPVMDGREFLRELRKDERLSDIPVVVISMVADEERGRLLGAADLLEKPVDPEQLAAALDRHVGRTDGRILVVEDDGDARLLLLRYLRDAGLDADGVDNAEDALSYLRRIPVELVILDLVLPGEDGLTLMERMRRDSRMARIPVVVVTGRELSAEEEETIRGHGARLVHKRNDVEVELRRALDRLFGMGDAAGERP